MTALPSSRAARRRLLIGCATILTLSLAAGSAGAQTSGSIADGAHSLANLQSAPNTATTADAGSTQTGANVATSVRASDIMVGDNLARADARTNTVTQGLDVADLAGGAATTTALRAGDLGASATGGAVISNVQTRGAATTDADILSAPASLEADSVSTSKLETSTNDLESLALGNDATASAKLSGSAPGGIVNVQTAGSGSEVAARNDVATSLAAGQVASSSLANSDNVSRAIAYGNSTEDTLSATGAMLTAATATAASGPAMMIAAPGGGRQDALVPMEGNADTAVDAAFGILSTQLTSGVVKGRVGDTENEAPAFATTVGDLDASTLGDDRNTQAAAGYGNSADNELGIDAATVSASGDGPMLANVTSVQRATGSRVHAYAAGGAAAQVNGSVSGSTMSVSDNLLRTAATTNVASNAIDLSAAGLTLPDGGAGGTAVIDSSENMAANAAVVLQNAQNAGTGIVNTLQLGNAAKIGVAGDISSSGLALDDNQALGSATGNDATNAATAKAATWQASIAVNSLQDSDGGVSVAIGSPTDRAGAMITGGAAVEDSSLSVSGNSLGGTATGQTVSNSLGLAAGAATSTQPGVPAASGSIGTSYGATGDLALANNQKLGEPSTDGSLTPAVTSTVFGDFGVAATGPVSRSSLTVDGNSQQALALGNGAINRLSASTTSPVAGDAPITVALASSQYGQARVAATSQAWFVGSGRLDASSTSLSGNSNLAQATINDADNALTIDVAGSASGPRGVATLSSDQLGPPVASGGAIVTNQQFAAGSVAAATTSTLGDGAGDRGLAGSEFTVADNVISAGATANHAINGASATGSGGAAGLGLVNAQINTASARADAAADAHYLAAPMAGALVDSSDLALNDNQVSSVARGNAASNTVTASGSDNVLPATAQAGRFDATAQGAAALVNSQANYAGITADAGATSLAVPLNAAGTIVGSTIAVSGNKVSASGYGNVAINSVTASPLGGSPGAAIANVQSNFGPVTALVTGAHAGIGSGPVANALLSITGNALSATAVGNQASNTITTGR